ncbi:MAG: glycoside hydrolase family 65, partial [Verrucomicrobia bacterium]|nr:glycoside hydrolase family 65 [Verrucomicrobiota bacterium]
AQHWPAFWKSGGAIDLSASKDPRWKELERRIVLSQYLTAVNSTGSAPPQESGLFSNSWDGKFHLEMTAWHGVHFVLWGRAPLVEGWMKWMRGPGLEAAKRQAAKQGYKGARWMKMIGPEPHWESPSGAGPFRLTQQGHAIFWAELMYREQPTRQTLEQFRDIVMQSAEFMADYVWWDKDTDRYVLGPLLLTGSEATPWAKTYNSTVENSYWFYGLRTAQLWRERLGLPRETKWDEVLAKLSKPPVVNGKHVDAESHPAPADKSHCRPAWLEAFGCMRGDEIDRNAMARSFDEIWGDTKGGTKWSLWGCDFPMLALTATRLERPHDAVDALLFKHKRNDYLPNGFNHGGSRPYLPASGGFLWAAAMMSAGWDGCPGKHAPGFPADGSWVVKWEGLKKAP